MKKYLKKNVGSLILAIVFAIAYAGAFVGISLLLQEIIDIALDKETALEIEDTLLSRKEQTLISISHHVLPEMRAKYDEIIELKDGTIRIA